MEYHLVTSISNHSRCSKLSIIIITITFPLSYSTLPLLSHISLFGRDSNSNRFLPSWGIIPNTHPYFPRQGRIGSPLVKLRSKSRIRPAPHPQRYYQSARMIMTQTCPWTHVIVSPHILTASRVHTLTAHVPGLSWATQLRDRNDLSSQLCERHAFNMTRWTFNGRSLNNTDGITMIPQHNTLPGLHLFNSTRLCPMIA